MTLYEAMKANGTAHLHAKEWYVKTKPRGSVYLYNKRDDRMHERNYTGIPEMLSDKWEPYHTELCGCRKTGCPREQRMYARLNPPFFIGGHKLLPSFRHTPLSELWPVEDKCSFWVVWSPEGGTPTKKHMSSTDAKIEARRLVSDHPEQEFFVLKAECRYRRLNEIEVTSL